MQWSRYQTAIFDFARQGLPANLAVRARAGCAKTTSLVELARLLPKGLRIQFCAFGRDTAKELQQRLPLYVPATTAHSQGLKGIRRHLGTVRVDKEKGERIAAEVLKKHGVVSHFTKEPTRARIDQMQRLVGLGKATMASTTGALLDLALDQAIVRPQDAEQFAALALEAMDTAARDHSCVDFDDMIYFPWRWGMCPETSQVILLDEVQDLSPAQIWLARQMCEARMVIVGDDRQCIPEGQRVSTPSGPRPIESLKEGDLVLAVKGGRAQPKRILRKTETLKPFAYEFDLGDYGKFQATPDHVVFAAIDDPMGCFVYLMHRPDLGFRIGVSTTVGNNGHNFIVRTQQEFAERLWVIDWFPDKKSAMELETTLSLQYGIPKEPFRVRDGMWCTTESTKRLFARFGDNGRRLLVDRGIDFDRPNYFAKAKTFGAGRIAVNLLLATKDGHRIEVESSLISDDLASELGMRKTNRGLHRFRCVGQNLRDMRRRAEILAEKLGGYIVEHLASTSSYRRMLAVRAESVHVGMRVPFVGAGGVVTTVPVLSRRKVEAGRCFDLEIEDLGNFIVENVVVHNCLYSWRGADSGGMDRLIKDLDATVFPLPVTYRCPRAVVRLANRLVPDLEAHEGAEEGVVRHEAGRRRVEREAQPGDFVLSRKNAPLVSMCLTLIAAGTPAVIAGRDVAKHLRSLLKTAHKSSVGELEAWLYEHRDKEAAKFRAMHIRPDRLERILQELEDRVDCLLALAQGASTIAEIEERLERLFSDENPTSKVVCSSIHRAKGLERDRVWVLADTLRPEPLEEQNIAYVAYTRARRELILVDAHQSQGVKPAANAKPSGRRPVLSL